MRYAAAVLLVMVAGTVPAAAQNACVAPADNSCLCVFPAGEEITLLDQPDGDIKLTETEGFTPIVEPTTLKIGDLVIFEADGTGILGGATCGRSVGPNISLTIEALGDACACAKVADRTVPPAGDGTAAVVGGVVIGGGILLFSQEEDDASD